MENMSGVDGVVEKEVIGIEKQIRRERWDKGCNAVDRGNEKE